MKVDRETWTGSLPVLNKGQPMCIGNPYGDDRLQEQDQDDREIMSPQFLFDTGMGGAISGLSLAESIAELTDEYGALTKAQYESVIEGHEQGARDRATYSRDMEQREDVPVLEDPIPF